MGHDLAAHNLIIGETERSPQAAPTTEVREQVDHNDPPLLSVFGIAVSFQGRKVLDGVDLEIRPQTITSLIGPNGSGKSTLVRTMLGIIKPNAGQVVRRKGLKLAYVPQRLTIDAGLPLTVTRFLDLPKKRSKAEKMAILQETGIADRSEESIHTLSGGEFQRMLLARALLDGPDLLVLDEPAQNVDFNGQAALFELLTNVRDKRGCAVILVSHEIHLVMAATDQVICLNNHVCCRGHPSTISDDPAYLALFGPKAAQGLAIYRHEHDHHHHLDGSAGPGSNCRG